MPPAFIYENKLSGVALRDQVAAVLRDGDILPMSPKQICSQLGTWRFIDITCGHADCTDPTHRRQILGERPYQSNDIRSALLSLEKKGLVERFVPDNRSGRAHYWRWIGPPSTDLPE